MSEQFHKPKSQIEPIESVQPRRPIDKLEETQQTNATEKVSFEQALEKADPSKAHIELRPKEAVMEAEKGKSLLDIAREAKSVMRTTALPSPDTLVAQATNLKQGLNQPRATLMSYDAKSIEIPSEFSKDMTAPLEHIDKTLIDAQKTMGVEAATSVAQQTHNPTVKFLHYMTDADKRLDTIVNEIMSYTADNKKLSPERLLAVQVKLNFVQQQLEFFTNILNRSVESIKTLMNIQI